MPLPKLSRLELRIMDTLWTRGASSVRELLEAFPEPERLAYTTVQTVVYRLESKQAIRRIARVGNAHVFEAIVSRSSAQHRLIDDLVALFGGKRLPIVTHLIESGRLTPGEVREAFAGRCEICRRKRGLDDPRSVAAPGESPVAIDPFCGRGGSFGAGLETKSGADPILSLARRVGQVLHSIFSLLVAVGSRFCTPYAAPKAANTSIVPPAMGQISSVRPGIRFCRGGGNRLPSVANVLPAVWYASYGRSVLRLLFRPGGGGGGRFGERCSRQHPYLCSTGFRSCPLRPSSEQGVFRNSAAGSADARRGCPRTYGTATGSHSCA